MTGAMKKIIPHLWYDRQASEAAEFYASIFPDSRVNNVTTLHDTPSGDAETVSFEVWGHPFMAISAGPLFRFNPSISFMVNFDPSRDRNARELLDTI
jgi:predicted 3-demethylubiquinone-9 3-methyltransferase (glyoxalase superfamily)